MERKNVYICMLAALLSCSDSVKVSRTLDAMPAIFPDYNGVVIPPNMAPLIDSHLVPQLISRIDQTISQIRVYLFWSNPDSKRRKG